MAVSSSSAEIATDGPAGDVPLSIRTRLAISVGVTLVMMATLLGWLGQPGPNYSTRPFLREPTVHKGWTIVRLAVRPLSDGTFEETGVVRVEPGADLDRASAISFQFDLYREGTNSGHVVLVADAVSGEATSVDGAVRFALAPNSKVPEKKLVRMERQTPMGLGADIRELRLRFVTRGDRRMALECNTVSYFPDSLTNNAWSWIRGPGQTKVFAPPGSPIYASLPIGQFTYPLQGPNLSRAEIIAFLWDFSGAASVRAAVAVLSLLFGVGLACASSGSQRLAIGAAGVALVFAAASGMYALLSPPLDAPDEQDHLISFYGAAGVADARARVMDLASRNHWERWVPVTSPFEKLSADDTRAPYHAITRDWATSGLVAQERSGVGGYYWRAIAPLVVRASTPQTLLALRWINAATVSASVFVSALLVLLRVGEGPVKTWAPFALVLIPAVTYLAMATSNYILVVGCGVMLAGALFPGRPGGVGELCSWLVAALAAGIAVQCSRSALSLVGLLPVLGWRWLRTVGEPDIVRLRSIWAVWAAIAAGFVLPWLISSPDYRKEILEAVQRLGGEGIRRALGSLPFPGWIAAAALAGGTVEVLLRKLGKTPGLELGRRARVLCAMGWLVVPVLLAVLLWFQTVKLPPSPTNGRELTAVSHAALGLGKFFGSLGPGQHDYLLSLTFWNILGWLEVQLPEWTIDLLATLALGGFALNWIHAARHKDGMRFLQTAALSLGCLGYLVAMLVASRAAGYTLVGRYMIMFFTVFLTFCWNGWLPLLGRLHRWSPTASFALWAALPALLHLFCWSRIVGHFF